MSELEKEPLPMLVPAEKRGEREWHYVLLGEANTKEWRSKNARVTEVLDFARLRRTGLTEQTMLL